MNPRSVALAAVAVVCAGLSGCTGRVVRTITVESDPPGALVWLNDNQVGRTPATTEFTWYGVYRVRLERPGYETLTVYEQVSAPPYEWVGPDLLFETIIPGTRRDHHRFGPYALTQAKPSDPDALLGRAREFRQEAIRGTTAR